MNASTATRSLLASLLITTTGFAQLVSLGQTKSTRYYNSYGPSSANVFVDLQAKASRSYFSPSVSASASAVAGANLLGYTARAMSINATGTSNQFSSGASLKVVLAGYTVLNDSFTTTAAWSRSFGPYDLFPVAPFIGVSIAGISVGVSCNAGAGAQAGFNMNLSPSNVGLSGYGRLYGTGRAKASVGALGFEAGARFDLRFLDSKGTPWLIASTSSLAGQLIFELKPLAIALVAYLKAPFVGEVGSKTIWSWSMASIWNIYNIA